MRSIREMLHFVTSEAESDKGDGGHGSLGTQRDDGGTQLMRLTGRAYGNTLHEPDAVGAGLEEFLKNNADSTL